MLNIISMEPRTWTTASMNGGGREKAPDEYVYRRAAGPCLGIFFHRFSTRPDLSGAARPVQHTSDRTP